jgi:L-rhamnose mutarotase
MQKREVILTELKPEFVEDYRRYHESVWPELEQVYRDAGYHDLSCFLSGAKLIIYMAYDEKKMTSRRDWLNEHRIEQKWQEIMRMFKDKTAESFEEIYRLTPGSENDFAGAQR